MKVDSWGYSENGEIYYGEFDSLDAAKLDAIKLMKDMPLEKQFWFGQYRNPMSPETVIDADLLLEHSWCQDDYCGDFCDEPNTTGKEKAELTKQIQEVYRAWLEKYDVMPKWKCIQEDSILRFTVAELIASVVDGELHKPNEES